MPGASAGRATIADVARRSGVSTATVSRVLSGSSPAAPATRERVLAAVRELDYRPSGVARALKRSETRTIGLLVTDIGNPFFPQLVRAVQDEAHARGYGVLLCNAADDPDREIASLDLLVERRVDGLVVASTDATRRHADRLAVAPMPVVLVNSATDDSPLPGIATDHRRGAALAASHLLALGHRRLAHIGGPRRTAAARERRDGVRDALHDANLDPGTLRIETGDEHVDGGAGAMERILASGEAAPTGVVAFNDLTAIGAVRALRRAGWRVPEDVSVVGFDDIEMAAWIDPPLTTVRQPVGRMARWAVERLVDHRSGADAPAPRLTLEPELVVRGSTAPPRPYGTV